MANGDTVTLALIQGVVNTFVMFLSRVIGHLVDRVVFKTEHGHGPAFFITMIVAALVLGILASMIVLWLSRRQLRISDGHHGEKFSVLKDGVRYFTPLFLVLILIEASDVVFAVDSIPAIFAITTDPFIVFTSNIFAIMGLRALYFRWPTWPTASTC